MSGKNYMTNDIAMPEAYETLFKSEWAEVRQVDGWYQYSHQPKSNGQGVAILPHRTNPTIPWSGIKQFLGRFEVTPSHGPDIQLCSITGMVDKPGKSIEQIVLEELAEEGGYRAEVHHLVNLGILRPNKGSDTIQYLFAIDLDQDGVVPCEATSDGTRGEQGAYCDWIDLLQLIGAKDPLLHAMHMRLQFIKQLR